MSFPQAAEILKISTIAEKYILAKKRVEAKLEITNLINNAASLGHTYVTVPYVRSHIDDYKKELTDAGYHVHCECGEVVISWKNALSE